MRSRLTILAVVAAAALSLVAIRPADAQTVAPLGTFIPADPHAVLPLQNADSQSLNWSGYVVNAAAGQKITEVNQHWTVVGAKVAPAGFSSTWAGIGGYTGTDLIQAGTESDSAQTPFAWYEILPASETPITSGCTGLVPSCAVAVGDKMYVDIKSNGGDSWTITMQDAGKWNWSLTLNYPSTFSSAEWILEAPTVGAQTTIAHVGVQQFTPGNNFVIEGINGATTKNIKQGNPVRVILSPGLVNEATPSALNAAGTAFNDCTYKQKCAAPA